MDEIKATIRAFVAPHFRTIKLQDDDDLFGLGFVSSLFALQLVNFVEQEFKITIENEDLELDYFRTIDSIAALVARKSGAVVDRYSAAQAVEP